MYRALCLGLLLVNIAFALDVDSLPVWNPDYLVHGYSSPVPEIPETNRSNIVTHGYKSLQVTVGDGGTQVDQEMRLSVQGNLSENIYVDALLSDVDRTGLEQTTATLQEIDQIYFRIESPHFLLHLGDFTWRDESLGFIGFERSTLGAMVGVKGGFSEVRGAVGSDEIERISTTFNGVSGQRDGYALGPGGSYLSIVPGSEKVWLNGVELRRDKDYVVNYAGGLLDFKGTLVPGNDDEIRVDYDAYDDENVYTMYAAKGKYRSPNLFLDLFGFRLENDVDRMRRSGWTDDEYRKLKNDDGGDLNANDSLGYVSRPRRTDKMGARIRFQKDRRFYVDLETAFSRIDSNIVSDNVDGPRGRAFRWFATSDSSYGLQTFPLALSVYGNYIENQFDLSNYVGSDRDWNAYKLTDEWDLDSNLISGDLRHDDFALRMRLLPDLFSKMEWGYRRTDDESWNSSRARFSLTHDNRLVYSELAFVRVASLQELQRSRYQATVAADYKQGFVRPFGNVDVRYTETESSSVASDSLYDVAYAKTLGGLAFVSDSWNVREALGTKASKKKAKVSEEWQDTLFTYVWQHSADANWRYFGLTQMLQYEFSELAEEGNQDSWIGDVVASFGERNGCFFGDVSYKLGMTQEQTYVAVYKAVAPGTGDVRYDSLTGTFIEGVDNGDFVYEGMGRNDSVGAHLASNAEFSANLEMKPGALFGVDKGFLRDISLGASYESEGEDTTGRKVYFPPLWNSQLRDVSSGRVSWEGRLEWMHPRGIFARYSPGDDFEKVMASFPYFQDRRHHDASMGMLVNESHFFELSGQYEEVDLNALQVLEWNTREGSLRYRFSFLDGFHVEPNVRVRYGEGNDEVNQKFEANLKEGGIRLGYERNESVDAFVRFSLIQMDDGGNTIPYQMMSGFGDGRTYRLEASVSANLNKIVTVGVHYVLRFGDAEENIFQKLSSEARAYF